MEYKNKPVIAIENFQEGDGLYKIHLADLNKLQVEEIEYLIEKWNPESEDEKIRKDLIKYFQGIDGSWDDVIVWLEKQKDTEKLISEAYERGFTEGKRIEQKNKIEKQNEQELNNKSLFKPKDWVIINIPESDKIKKIPYYIISVHEKDYGVVYNGIAQFISKKLVDEFGKIWDIFDANPGDILINGNTIFIFKNIKDNNVYEYCHLYLPNSTDCINSTYHINHFECATHTDGMFSPTTKEQQELFFQKMKEDGYEWDEEKLKLKKLLYIKSIKKGKEK